MAPCAISSPVPLLLAVAVLIVPCLSLGCVTELGCAPTTPVDSASLLQHTTRSEKNGSAHKALFLCRVRRADNSMVNVIMLGNHRYLDFGDWPEQWQAKVHCPNTHCTEHDTVVEDVATCPACPCDQRGAMLEDDMYYNGPLFEKIEPVCRRANLSNPVNLLLIGLGGGALHRHVLERCPSGTRVHSVEVDTYIKDLAQHYFGLEIIPNRSEVHIGDALKVVSDFVFTKTVHWDVILVDCFNDDDVPGSCKSVDFLGAVRDILKPTGTLLQHVYHDWPGDPSQAEEFREIVSNYKEVFGAELVGISRFPAQLSELESIIHVPP